MTREIKRIRIDIKVAGEGEESHEYEYCELVTDKNCKLRPTSGACNFGLTTIEPPTWCPMRIAPLQIKMTIV